MVLLGHSKLQRTLHIASSRPRIRTGNSRHEDTSNLAYKCEET